MKMRNKINDFLKTIRHTKPTYALSLDDEPIKPDKFLIDLTTHAINNISNINLKDMTGLFGKKVGKWINTWPGEHYLLLASITQLLCPKLIIEIGTATGASCLCMKRYLPLRCGKIVTYDLIPWNEFKRTGLSKKDFDDKLEQRVLDLTKSVNQKTQKELFKSANIIFIDAAKDFKTEGALSKFLDSIKFDNPPLVIFDDIKLLPMLEFWRNIKHPKMDITSLGHWAGTGIVHWI